MNKNLLSEGRDFYQAVTGSTGSGMVTFRTADGEHVMAVTSLVPYAGSGAVFSLSAGTDVFSVFCGRIRKICGRKNVCLQPSALSGNQKILGSPGDAGDVRSTAISQRWRMAL